MPEILRLHTNHFALTVWCKDNTKRRQTHQNTVNRRTPFASDGLISSAEPIKFFPPITLEEAVLMGQRVELENLPAENLSLTEPLFFENMQYQFEWIFLDQAANVDEAKLIHRSHLLNEAFRFLPAQGLMPARLTGIVSTGNDVGWLRLPLEYSFAGKTYQRFIAFEVLASKMDLHADLPAMYETIDQEFPLWRFSLAEKTEQNTKRGQHRGYFPLLWLASFNSLRERLGQGLKVVAQAPHSRLQPEVHFLKPNRMKGRVPHRLASRIKEGILSGQHDRRYKVERKRLSVDTPENQFIKMVVIQSAERLSGLEARLRLSNQAPDRQRLSTAFLQQIHSWQQPLRKIRNQSFLKEVSDYRGTTGESLVLQQKTGYSTVYQIWQELKFYLDAFDGQSAVSMKSVAEIYEVWCFLEIRNILIKQLGFKDVTRGHRKLTMNQFYEYQLKDGFAGAFEFEREDGVSAKLAHEPIFSKKGKQIRSYLVNQEPDIVLEVQQAVPSGKRFIWVFDAKYRIKTETGRFNTNEPDECDLVPDDAINQMHRYRDALIHITKNQFSGFYDKSRPVVGAFALYPGFFDQRCSENPYSSGIAEVGIGAFAMLPDSNNMAGAYWLSAFLRDQLGVSPTQPVTYEVRSREELWSVNDSARIPYHGMKQLLYPDLTLTVALGGQKGRDPIYLESFKNGSAGWYHIPQRTFHFKYKQHIAQEIRFLALASTSSADSTTKQIDKLWPVIEVRLAPRKDISVEKSGAESESTELYYLFKLGKPLTIKEPVYRVPHRPIRNSMKLTRMALLDAAGEFRDLKTVYEEALK